MVLKKINRGKILALKKKIAFKKIKFTKQKI